MNFSGIFFKVFEARVSNPFVKVSASVPLAPQLCEAEHYQALLPGVEAVEKNNPSSTSVVFAIEPLPFEAW